jgi:hypothetical protein
MYAHNASPSPEWYEPADLIDDDEPVLDVAPIPLRRPTAALTPKGHAVLNLIREQDGLDVADTAARECLERAISELLDS